MYETRQTTIPFSSRLNDYYYKEKKGSYGPQFLKAYSYGASHIDNSIPRKEKGPGSFTLLCYINNVCFDNSLGDLGDSVSVVPLSTYINLGLGELAHTKLTVELSDRTVKYPKGIAGNILVGIGKVRDEKIIFNSVKPASSFIKRVYMLRLRERMELDLEARLMGETLGLNISIDPLNGDYIKLNDLNEPLELRQNQVDDLMPTIEKGEVSIRRIPDYGYGVLISCTVCLVLFKLTVVIMEYLVKTSKRACILELKQRNMKITDPDIKYAISIKEDTTYLCLHFTKDHKGTRSIRGGMMVVADGLVGFVFRLFLAYDSFKDFMVYQMDVKSAFLYEKLEEEVYVCQPSGFEDPEFLDKVHKGDILLVQVYVDDIIFGSTKKELCIAFEKMIHEKFQMSYMGKLTFFLELQVKQEQDGIFISQDKYVTKILKKYRFTEVKNASTPMKIQKPLLKDGHGEEVDVNMYRSMIGSLMYLTFSRPDIMYAVFTCAIYQVNPKVERSLLWILRRRLHLSCCGCDKRRNDGCSMWCCIVSDWPAKGTLRSPAFDEAESKT
nr:hypothetical protein [Tanacetum cinerariifolium]